WSWKLRKVRLVSMFPTRRALFTTSTPSRTIHSAGDLSFVCTHSSRFLPSKRTIAFEGGAELSAPGVTTFGAGSQTSVSFGLPRRPFLRGGRLRSGLGIRQQCGRGHQHAESAEFRKY